MTINSLTYHRRNTSERATYLSVLAWLVEHKEEQHRLTMPQPNGSLWMDFDSSDHRTVGAWGIPVSHRAIVVRFSTDGTVTLYPRRVLRCTNPGTSSEYSYSCTIGRTAFRCLPTSLTYTSAEGNHIEIHAWYAVDHTAPDDKPGYYAPIRTTNDPLVPAGEWHYYGEQPPAYTIDWSARQLAPDSPLPDEVFARHYHCHPWTLPYTVY